MIFKKASALHLARLCFISDLFLYVLADGPFMLLLFAGIASLCLAFVELFVYALLRSKRATLCLPSGGPTSSRGGKTCSIIKEELTSVISRSSESKRRSQLEPHINNGLSSSTSPRINRYVKKLIEQVAKEIEFDFWSEL